MSAPARRDEPPAWDVPPAIALAACAGVLWLAGVALTRDRISPPPARDRVPGLVAATTPLHEDLTPEDESAVTPVNAVAEPDRLVRKAEPVPTPQPPPSAPEAFPGRPAKVTAGQGAINVNVAAESELQRLPGVGAVLAARIVAAREERPFAGVADLRRVPGIGPKTLEKLRPVVRFGP